MTATLPEVQPQDLPVPRSVITAMIVLAASIIMCAAAFASSDHPTEAVVWGSLAVCGLATALLCISGARDGVRAGLSCWKFGPWVLVWYGLTFGLATITFRAPQTGTMSQIAISSVLRALWLVAVGMTVWAMGYMLGPGHRARQLSARVARRLGRAFTADVRSPLAPWILYAIGTAARLASLATTGRFGYLGDASSAFGGATSYQQFLGLLSSFGSLAVAAAALQVFRERLPGARLTLIILMLGELAVGVASGHKSDFIVTVLCVAIPYGSAHRHIHKPTLVISILAFMVIVIPFTASYRSTVRNGISTLTASQAIGKLPDLLSQTVRANDMLTVLSNSSDYLLSRLQEIDAPAIILQRTPRQVPFSSTFSLLETPVAELVPRAIWPSKPIISPGVQFSRDYYAVSASIYTASAITPLGDLYRHGGWIPVIVGMFLLGLGIRLLDDVLDIRANPHFTFPLILLFPTIVGGEKDFVSIPVGVVQMLVISWLAVCLTFRPRQLT